MVMNLQSAGSAPLNTTHRLSVYFRNPQHPAPQLNASVCTFLRPSSFHALYRATQCSVLRCFATRCCASRCSMPLLETAHLAATQHFSSCHNLSRFRAPSLLSAPRCASQHFASQCTTILCITARHNAAPHRTVYFISSPRSVALRNATYQWR